MNHTPIPESLKSTPLLLVLQYEKSKPYYTIDKPSTAERFACTKILAWKELEPIKTSFHYYVVDTQELKIIKRFEADYKSIADVLINRYENNQINHRLCETKEAALRVLDFLMKERLAHYKEYLP
jgi:hypothetical protein